MKRNLTLALSLFVAAALFADSPKPPVAKKVPKSATMFGDTRVDEYGWIRDKSSPEAIAYLEAENTYTEAVMKPTADLQKKLYDEMLSHIKQTDSNVPYRKGDYFYYTRTEEGKQYPIFARKKGSLDAPEQITIDVNKLAEGQKFMNVGRYEISDDGNLLAYSTDNVGYRQYVLHVKDLRTGEDLPDRAEKTGSILWGADNKTLFYTVENPAKRRAHVELLLALNLRQFGHGFGQITRDGLNVDAELLKNRQHHAVLLLDQRPQQMLGSNLRIVVLLCVGLSRLKGLLALQRQLIKTNHF